MSNQAIPPAQTLDVDTVDQVIRNLLVDMRSGLDRVQALRDVLPADAGNLAQHQNLQQRSLAMYNQCRQLHTLLRRVDLETARIQQSVYNANIVSNTEALGSTNTTLQDIRMDIARLQSSLLSRGENPISPETVKLRERIRNLEAENEQLSNRIRESIEVNAQHLQTIERLQRANDELTNSRE